MNTSLMTEPEYFNLYLFNGGAFQAMEKHCLQNVTHTIGQVITETVSSS